MTGDWISMQGSLSHYSSGTGVRISGDSTNLEVCGAARLASLRRGGRNASAPTRAPRDECVRLKRYLRARRRILEVKALPWHAVKVGFG